MELVSLNWAIDARNGGGGDVGVGVGVGVLLGWANVAPFTWLACWVIWQKLKFVAGTRNTS